MAEEKQAPLSSTEGELAPCEIHIDQEGDWYYRGSLMQRSDIVTHLCRHVRREEDSGEYIIRMGGQECYLEVEDTPLVISRVTHHEGGGDAGSERFLLSIKHLEEVESLNPKTLRVGRDNVLYCTVTPDRLPARFLRPAYYQLAEFIREDPAQGRFYLVLSGQRYYIHESAAGTADER